MSEERLQEIKDSISLQYKVQEANDLNNFNIFTDEEQELVEEIERLNNIIESFEEELERESNMKEENTCLEHNTFLDIRDTLKTVLKRFRELKGSDKE